MKKLIIKENSGGQAVLFEAEIEKELDSEDYKTTYIYRERLATPKEVLMYHTGFGYFLKF